MQIAETIFALIVLSVVVASIAWTVTQEEIFAELREICGQRCKSARTVIERKFFYVFTCEYCFSHWVSLVVIIVSGFRLLYDDWRGFLAAFFVMPWLANQWMSIYRRIRVEIKYENALATIADDDKKISNEFKTTKVGVDRARKRSTAASRPI